MSDNEIRQKTIEEEYVKTGWRTMDDLLSLFERNLIPDSRIVWAENFEAVRDLAASIGKDRLIELFNADTENWVMDKDPDGTLFVIRRY